VNEEQHVICDRALPREDFLRNVHVPTLVIAGEHDAWSLGMSREMNDRIAGSRLAILPRSKHMTFVDQTEMFNRSVDEFVHTNRPVVP
jgi:pimeloyl-ACP methyl ester carboxylesterase